MNTVNPNVQTLLPVRSDLPVRAAAYCRVSTGHEEQEGSLRNQAAHFSELIRSRPDWAEAGIYQESAVSGTKKAGRPELMRLLADCREGKIDLVLTKSISRFARSTIDCLEMIRCLKELGVTVYFEKEHLDTGSMESELLLTLLASFAEEESRSISRNTAWAKRNQFETGSYRFSKAPYGYCLIGGTLEIDPAEAPVVKRIFRAVLAGKGTPLIARDLNVRGIPTGTRKRDGSPGSWTSSMLLGLLGNTVYTGDLILQKTFRDEHFHRQYNYGELPRYYIADHHASIIDRETFALAGMAVRQRGLEKGNVPPSHRRLNGSPHSRRSSFSGRLRCGICSSPMIRITQTRKDGKAYHWACRTHLRDRKACPMTREREESVRNAFRTMLRKLAYLEPVLLPFYQRRLKAELAAKNASRPATRRAMSLLRAAGVLRKHVLEYRNSSDPAFPETAFAETVDHAVIRTGQSVTFHLLCGLTLTEPLYEGGA